MNTEVKERELKKADSSHIIIDKRLNENSKKVFFPEKVKKAEEILRKYPPPESLLK